MHNFKFVFFILLLSVLILPNQNAYAKSLKHEKWVFIGDSYAENGRPNHTIPILTAKAAGLSRSHYSIQCCHGGQGLIGWKEGKAFSTRLINQRKDIKVTKVIVIGGINNDGEHSKETLQAAAIDFFKLVREKYPKAKIYYTIPNWYANYNGSPRHSKERAEKFKINRERITLRLKWYREFCRENNIIFLAKSTNALHQKNNTKFFVKDGHHPSIKGRRKVAKLLAKELRR